MSSPRPFGGEGEVGCFEETNDISDYNTFTFLDISPTLHIAKYVYIEKRLGGLPYYHKRV